MAAFGNVFGLGFTLEGFGAAWIDSIDGNPGTIANWTHLR